IAQTEFAALWKIYLLKHWRNFIGRTIHEYFDFGAGKNRGFDSWQLLFPNHLGEFEYAIDQVINGM
ncbi:MAG: hypothetical protein Q9210_005138, partial [Variospora velana]